MKEFVVDPQEARTQLEQLLVELEATTATLEHEGIAEADDIGHVEQHQADTASELSDKDRERALIKAAEERMVEVMAALVRLDEGTWGTCVDCGSAIPQERLAVRPEAARCVQDQARVEAALSS